MKAGTFNANDYLDRLYEEAEASTEKGYILSDTAGLPLPEDTKKNFDWLNKEYQKGKVEVKVEISGEGSSFKPGYDLQTDVKSVKDFKPGMYGEVKTGDTGKKDDGPLPRGEAPASPTNKTTTPAADAEETDPKDAKEAGDNQKKPISASAKSPAGQKMNIDIKTKKKNATK